MFLASCSGSEETGGQNVGVKANVQGIIEKGPFVQGSKVTLYDLDSRLSQTGKTYTTNTRSDLGAFDFGATIELSSRYAEFETSGFFYNECDSSLSKAPITLKAIADVSAKKRVNVNLLTHLEYARVKHLIKSGLAFVEAKKQAEKELLKVFAITDEIANPENISITDGNKNSAILLAISSVMLYDKSEAEFSDFISRFSSDFEDDGIIENANISKEINKGQENCHPGRIAHAMKRFYAEKGSVVEMADFSAYIDFNGDGSIDSEDKEMLDVTPDPVVVNPDSDMPNVQAAVNELYILVRQYTQGQLELEAIRLGLGSEKNITPSSNLLQTTWTAGYAAINRGNSLMEALNRVTEFDTAPYSDQVKALIAFVYYNMAMSWGNIPIAKTDAGGPGLLMQSNASAVYAYCKELLKNTAPTATQQGMVSSDFVTALSAEIALAENKAADAGNLLTQLPVTDIFFFNNLEGNPIEVYTADYIRMLKEESTAEAWIKRGNRYGTWAALKRLGKAATVAGISNEELLLPIPQHELYTNPNLRQNPGY